MKVICKWLKNKIRIISCYKCSDKELVNEVKKGQSPTAAPAYKQVYQESAKYQIQPVACFSMTYELRIVFKFWND